MGNELKPKRWALRDRDAFDCIKGPSGRITRLKCRECGNEERLIDYYQDGASPETTYRRARGGAVGHFGAAHPEAVAFLKAAQTVPKATE